MQNKLLNIQFQYLHYQELMQHKNMLKSLIESTATLDKSYFFNHLEIISRNCSSSKGFDK